MCPFRGGFCASYRFGLKSSTVLVCIWSVTSAPTKQFAHIYVGPSNHVSQHNFKFIKVTIYGTLVPSVAMYVVIYGTCVFNYAPRVPLRSRSHTQHATSPVRELRPFVSSRHDFSHTMLAIQSEWSPPEQLLPFQSVSVRSQSSSYLPYCIPPLIHPIRRQIPSGFLPLPSFSFHLPFILLFLPSILRFLSSSSSFFQSSSSYSPTAQLSSHLFSWRLLNKFHKLRMFLFLIIPSYVDGFAGVFRFGLGFAIIPGA